MATLPYGLGRIEKSDPRDKLYPLSAITNPPLPTVTPTPQTKTDAPKTETKG